MPKKQKSCRGCGHKLKEVPNGNGYAHKKREHWTPRPHKEMPAEDEVSAPSGQPVTHDHHAPLG